ncbi:protein brambleberry isoform X2 [Syngnathus typhle]|nr:protein brambleberry isoform X2 [Syngnathus typhle]
MGHLLSYRNCLLLLCIFSNWIPATTGLFEWLRQTEHPPAETAPPPPSADAILAKEAQFEMSTADERFLSEAKQMELSPLDSCHHKVVAQLKVSCEGLSEEELAKLGVTLFNCQAQIEGRTTYPCTQHMSIKECTAAMDPDTWNAYHIVSNRARAVCYASRQQLFRLRAEHTINMLISTAASQLAAMEDLKDGQLELRELTAASLDRLLKGHGELQTQQVKLHKGQSQMQSDLRDNLQRLAQEKALIASGQELVARLIREITDRMALVRENVQMQGSQVQDRHRAVVQDLEHVRHQAQDIQQKLDDSVSEFVQYRERTLRYYADVMSKLERTNISLGVVLRFLDETRGHIEQRLDTIRGYLDWAGELHLLIRSSPLLEVAFVAFPGFSVTAMWTCVTHAGYFLLFAVLQSFLCCPVFSRAALLLTVPLNAAAEVNGQPALDPASLGFLMVMLWLGHWFVSQLRVQFPSRGRASAAFPFETVEPRGSCDTYPQSSTPHKKEYCCSGQNQLLKQETGDLAAAAGSSHRKLAASGPAHHCLPPFLAHPVLSAGLIDDIPCRKPFDSLNDSHLTNDSRSASPLPSMSTSSLLGRPFCKSITKARKVCKKRAVFGQDYCRIHQDKLDFSSLIN